MAGNSFFLSRLTWMDIRSGAPSNVGSSSTQDLGDFVLFFPLHHPLSLAKGTYPSTLTRAESHDLARDYPRD